MKTRSLMFLISASFLGYIVPEMPSCPLVPDGTAATVSSTGDGFSVAIRSNESATAKETSHRSIEILRAEMPACCRRHLVPSVDRRGTEPQP